MGNYLKTNIRNYWAFQYQQGVRTSWLVIEMYTGSKHSNYFQLNWITETVWPFLGYYQWVVKSSSFKANEFVAVTYYEIKTVKTLNYCLSYKCKYIIHKPNWYVINKFTIQYENKVFVTKCI